MGSGRKREGGGDAIEALVCESADTDQFGGLEDSEGVDQKSVAERVERGALGGGQFIWGDICAGWGEEGERAIIQDCEALEKVVRIGKKRLEEPPEAAA